MNRSGTEAIERLALLPTAIASKYLTSGIRAGQERLPEVAILRASASIEERSARWDVVPVREILTEAVQRFGASRTGADAWLAPRLHATLRMTRGEAARPELWNFLALAVAPDYVLWRHLGPGARTDGEPGKVASARFVGPHYSQAFSRLWWAAEIFRDGADYRPAEIACGNQDMLNTALRLDAVDHKPTAIAMTRVLLGLAQSGASRLGDRVNALCTAVNVAGSTLMYDVLAPHDLPDQDALRQWILEAETAPSVPWDRLPDGPDDGTARPSSVERLTQMFERFSSEAPLRQRKQGVNEADDSDA
ncbi:hypothetical protein GA0115240_144848 [Streptomyces sp. DvalAA-14]|uniref:DUF6339 family protein n=1 Tax=unclassified Streptomyces TaxID=2593676 RepID=UPI00081B81A8|nr:MULTISPECIES: DUF6339 family protein [unclassified Streptomyces]MYS22796.1 hypothetical protein [Streptomyces sp. SID4948]SCE22551.1 hypothetical protein GA0115240_144848 [Streptomyces sp. DvalAA-14]